VHAGTRWYLVAWDLDREDWRSFRVDRITSKASAGRRFVPRKVPHGDVAQYVARSISTGVYPHQVRVLLHAPLESVAERIPPLAGQLARVSAERCLLETGGHSLGSLAYYIATLGFDFEVQEPPELREQLRELGQRLSRSTK
jgi:predicted DNA-binding transcriptional regulator YafY